MGLVAQAQARLRVEQVHVAGLRTNEDGLTLHRRATTVDACNDVVALAIKDGVAVDVSVGTEFFNDVNLNLEAFAVADGLEVFRTRNRP